MKKLLFALLSLISYCLQAQVNSSLTSEAYMPVYPLEVTSGKTTSIIFPEDIISADVGSISVLVEPFDKVKNILRVKANLRPDQPGFSETSLSVVTADSKMWTFVVNYSANPDYLSLDMNKAAPRKVKNPVTFKNAQASLHYEPVKDINMKAEEVPGLVRLSETRLDPYTIKILNNESRTRKPSVKHLGIEQYGIDLHLTNIFIRENVMFFQISLKNKTHIEYEVDAFNILVKDGKSGKKSSHQEHVIYPLLDVKEFQLVEGKKKQVLSFPIRKLTIPDNKEIWIQVFEKNGGRHLEFQIQNGDILESKEL